MAEKTRRAYGVDLAQLAEWASAHDRDPGQLDHRALRRFAGVLSERGASKSTVARKLAAIRTFYRALVADGAMEASPADLVASPKPEAYLPTVLKPAGVRGLLDSMPASTPLELRDRAIFELAYSAGLRAEELVNLELGGLDLDAEELRVEGKGGRTRIVPAGEPAWRALRVLPRPRAPRAAAPGRPGGAVPVQERAAALHVRRAQAAGAWRCAARRCSPESLHTRFATHLRPTCWRAGRTSGRSRSCSATPPSVRPRPTLG